jgi:glycosyltransferase involved in cell wall biosynthesis
MRLKSGARASRARVQPPGRQHSPPLILHIVEAFGGGVMTAVNDYTRNTDEQYRHIILARKRPQHDTGRSHAVEFYPLGSVRGLPITYVQTARLVRRLRPDVVHLHSSWAGVLGRVLPIDRQRIVYTPHCFAFERSDVRPLTRWLLEAVERVLAYRTEALAGVSPREAALGAKLRPSMSTYYVPNVAPHSCSKAEARTAGPIVVTTVGRVSPQKDPQWFIEFAANLRDLGGEYKFQWLGGGDEKAEAPLKHVGIDVSGWLSHDEIIERLVQSHVYVHSAAWEGLPLSLLEACSAGLPVVARSIPAFESLGLPDLQQTPKAAAQHLHRQIREEKLDQIGRRMRRLADEFSDQKQKDALLAVYRNIIREAKAGAVLVEPGERE